MFLKQKHKKNTKSLIKLLALVPRPNKKALDVCFLQWRNNLKVVETESSPVKKKSTLCQCFFLVWMHGRRCEYFFTHASWFFCPTLGTWSNSHTYVPNPIIGNMQADFRYCAWDDLSPVVKAPCSHPSTRLRALADTSLVACVWIYL